MRGHLYRLRAFLFTLAVFAPTVVAAQQFPTIPDGSVVGRIGNTAHPSSGPSQAIPFSTLAAQLNSNGVIINPTPNTTNQALIINQTLPIGSQSSGPYAGSLSTITNNGYTSTASGFSTTTGLLNALVSGQRIDYLSAGSGAGQGPIQIGSMVTAAETSQGQQMIGFHASAATNIASAGNDDIWGFTGYAYVGPSANLASAHAVEAQSAIRLGSTVINRSGVSIVSIADGSATSIDSAVVISSQPSPLAVTSVPFTNGITLWTPGGTQPIASTGSVLTANAAFTMANFANFPTSTVTGNILNFPFVQITGLGSATFGGGSSATSNVVKATCSTCGFAELTTSANGVAGADSVLINDSSGNNGFVAGAFEAGSTLVRFGQTTGNWGQVTAFGSNNVGLMMGTLTNEPLILGTNNTARISVTGAGGIGAAGPVTVTSNSAGALVVGANGSTNAVLDVDASAASVATGLGIAGQAAGNGLALNVLSSGTNENLGINAKGSGQVVLGHVSTGGVKLGDGGGGVNIASALTYAGTTFNNTVTGSGNLVGSVSPTFTGTLTAATLSPATINAFTAGGAIAMGGNNITGGGSATFTTFTGALTGHASLDLPLTGGTMSGNIAFSPSTAGITGTATNDNAAAGIVGEYVASALTSNAATNTVTITIASPAVVTWSGGALPYIGTGNYTAPIVFSTTGALPTGITAGTVFWVIGSTVNAGAKTFQIATSPDNALAGTAVNTSGTQSGTQTGLANVPLTSGTFATSAGIQLGVGDWDVDLVCYFPNNAATSFTLTSCSISGTSGNNPDSTPGKINTSVVNATVFGGTAVSQVLPPYRLSLSSPTSVFLNQDASFSVNTANAAAKLSARRAR